MLVTSMPLHKVVEEWEEGMLVEAISAPIEQREELSAEQDETGLGERDPIADQMVLLRYSTITSFFLSICKILEALTFLDSQVCVIYL